MYLLLLSKRYFELDSEKEEGAPSKNMTNVTMTGRGTSEDTKVDLDPEVRFPGGLVPMAYMGAKTLDLAVENHGGNVLTVGDMTPGLGSSSFVQGSVSPNEFEGNFVKKCNNFSPLWLNQTFINNYITLQIIKH